MGKWDRWGWLTYSCLFVVAVIEAADQALKGSANLASAAFLHSNWWAFAPLALILLATVLMVARALGWIGKTPPGGGVGQPREAPKAPVTPPSTAPAKVGINIDNSPGTKVSDNKVSL